MKKLLAILAVFLLLSLAFTASAETGSVKVIHINSDGSKTDITDKNHEEADNNDDGSSSGNSQSIIETPVPTETKISEDSILAAQTAGENALYGFTNGMIDSLYEGSMSIYEADISKDESGIARYNISVRELDPYEQPLVAPVQLVTFCFLILVTIITILGSMFIAAFQTKRPESYGDLKRSISGVYVPYNPNRVHTACMWSITRPVEYYLGFIGFIYGRNFLLSSLPQTSSGVLGAATDNIIIRGITGLAIFIGSLQTSIAEYGVYAFGTILFILCIITDILVLFNASEEAKKLEFVAWGAFGVFCLCDIINMFCTSYGVITSESRGESIFITVGIVFGGFINAIILAVLTVYAVLKGKKTLGV